MTAVRIEGVIRRYAWGSTSAIPQLLGQPVGPEPAAELWLGAHPDDPSAVVETGVNLDALIAADPALLGAPTRDRFGTRLPFLLKLLAADKALSLQVHPSLAQARAGFAAEQAPGFSGPHNYHDDNHKPELLCALTEFSAYCGFRPIDQTVELLTALRGVSDAPVLLGQLSLLGELLTGEQGLRAAFTWLLRLPAAEARAMAEGVVTCCRSLAAQAGDWSAEAGASVVAGTDFPGDIGAVVGLLLNFVVLQPGEAIFLGAGNVHAYLRGLGVEIMANSDNVLRCGLTPKHIDVDELLRITDFSVLPDPRWKPVPARGVRSFAVPVPDFALTQLTLDELGPTGAVAARPAVLAPGLPRIVLVTAGSAEISSDGSTTETLTLAQGQAAFIPAATEISVQGSGTLFCASPGLTSPSE